MVVKMIVNGGPPTSTSPWFTIRWPSQPINHLLLHLDGQTLIVSNFPLVSNSARSSCAKAFPPSLISVLLIYCATRFLCKSSCLENHPSVVVDPLQRNLLPVRCIRHSSLRLKMISFCNLYILFHILHFVFCICILYFMFNVCIVYLCRYFLFSQESLPRREVFLSGSFCWTPSTPWPGSAHPYSLWRFVKKIHQLGKRKKT